MTGVRAYWRAGVPMVLLLYAGTPARLHAQCPDGSPPPCAPARPPALPSIVVRPFENRGEADDAYLAAALSDDLTSALAASGAVRLLSARPGQRGADFALSGGVRRTGDAVRVSTRLERLASGEIVWSESLDYQRGRSSVAVERLAHGILRRVSPAAGRAPARARQAASDPAVVDLLQRGRYYLLRPTEANVARAIEVFQNALARDSSSAAAWGGLASAMGYAVIWELPVPGVPKERLMTRMIEAAERALLLDSTDAEMWIARGVVGQRVDPTTNAPAIRAFSRALSIDSLNIRAWFSLAVALQEQGDTLAARETALRSVAIDPSHVRPLETLALLHYWGRQYDTARVWADSAVAVDPTFLGARRISGSIALAQSRYRDAEIQFEAARAVGPGPERIWAISGLGIVAAARGDTAVARALAAEAEALTDSVAPSRHAAVFLAWIFTAVGDRPRALRWLERYRPAADLHFQQHLKRDQPLDALRAEPRFQALLR